MRTMPLVHCIRDDNENLKLAIDWLFKCIPANIVRPLVEHSQKLIQCSVYEFVVNRCWNRPAPLSNHSQQFKADQLNASKRTHTSWSIHNSSTFIFVELLTMLDDDTWKGLIVDRWDLTHISQSIQIEWYPTICSVEIEEMYVSKSIFFFSHFESNFIAME